MQGVWLSPRVLNLLLQYLQTAVSLSKTWKVIKPFCQGLLESVVFPLLCCTDEDLRLWNDDPQEYIRKVPFSPF